MAKQVINIGRSVNDKTGDPIRTAFGKVNDNFTELYNLVGSSGTSYTLPVATTLVLGGVKIDGTSITINPEGIISTSGGTGMKGDKGDTGATGPQGPQGIQGPQGLQGIQGPAGAAGAQGAQGGQGPEGPQGAAGDQGPTGPQGDTGAQGIAGAKGDQGITGAQGDAGPRGDTGAQGISVTLQGTKATIADLPAAPVDWNTFAGHGWIVTSGDGITHANGSLWFWNLNTGQWNDIGPIVGPQGDTGATGPRGLQGPQGNDGLQGIQGPAGAAGAQGPEGAQGPRGLTGPQGSTGPAGPQGDTGPQGPGADQDLNTYNSVQFRTVTLKTPESNTLLDNVIALVTQLNDAFAADSYTGLGYPASSESYAQLQRAQASNPLIPSLYLTIAHDLDIAYRAYYPSLVTLDVDNTNGFTIANGFTTVGFGGDGTLTIPGGVNSASQILIESNVDSNTSGVWLDGDTATGNAILYATNDAIIRANNNNTNGQGIKDWTFNKAGHIVPGSDILQDIGTPTNRVRHIYVGPGSITVGNAVISESNTGKLVLPGLTRATALHADQVEDTGDQTRGFGSTPTIIDNTEYLFRDGQAMPSNTYVAAAYSVDQLDGEGFIDGISVDAGGTWTQIEADSARNNGMWATEVNGALDNWNSLDWIQIPFVVRTKADDVEYEFNTGGGGGSALVQRTVNYPVGEAGDTAGTLALDPQGNVYVCIADYQQNEGQGYTVVTSEGYNISQSGGVLMSVVIALGDYPAIDAILQAASLPLTGWQASGNVTDGYVRNCIAEQWTGNRWGFTWTYVEVQDESSYSQGEEFELTYTGPQAAIWEQLSTGTANRVQFQNAGSIYQEADNDPGRYNIVINAEKDVVFNTDEGSHTFSLTSSGTLKFPDGTEQSTAATGGSSGSTGELYIMANVDGTIVTSTDGVTWGDPLPSGMPGIYKVAIHNGVIVYIPSFGGPPGSGPVGLYYSTEIGTTTLCEGTDSFVGVDLVWNNVRYFSQIEKWVAVGYIQGTYNSPVVAHSTTGISWTLVPIDGAFENSFNTSGANWRLNDITYIAETQKFVIASTLNNGFGGVFVTSDITQALNGSNHVAIELNVAKVVPWSVIQYGGPPGYLMLFGEVNGPGGTTEVWYGISTTTVSDYGQDTSFWGDVVVSQIGYLPEISEVAYDANDFIAVTTDGQVITPAFAMGPYWTVSVPVPYTAAINDIIRNQTDIGRMDAFTTSPLVGSQDTFWTTFNGNVTVGNDVFLVAIDGDSVLVSCTLVTGDVHTVGDTITLPGSAFGGTDGQDDIVVTVTGVISATTIEFTGINGQGMAYGETVEKITISGVTSHTENGSTTEQSYNNSYYAKKVTINNVDSYELYTDKECTTPWDTRTYWPVDIDTGTLTWSHGTYFDAAGTSPGYYYIGNDDEQIFRSSNGVTWVQQADVTGEYFNDFAYGSFGQSVVNRLDYTDSTTGYHSSAVLTYDFDVDVDNAHLNIRGDGSWDIGSSNFRTKIYSAGPEEPTLVIVQSTDKYWTFSPDGKLSFPDGTKQATAYVPRNTSLDGGGASVHYEIDTVFVDGGFSSTRHGVADAAFDGGNRLTENNLYNLDGGGA